MARGNVVSDEDFVVGWQAATDAADAADTLGISEAAAAGRARRLRKLGVALKEFPRKRRSVDVEALNALLGA